MGDFNVIEEKDRKLFMKVINFIERKKDDLMSIGIIDKLQ